MRTARDTGGMGQITMAKNAPTKQPEFREVKVQFRTHHKGSPGNWEIILDLK